MSQRRFRYAYGTQAACAVWLVLAAAAARGGDDADSQLTHRFGLVKVSARVWGLPLERQLRERWSRLPELRERIASADKELQERIEKNRQAWQQVAPAIAVLDAQLALLSSGDPQRPALVRQRRALAASAVEPDKLAERDSVRSMLVQSAQDRCALAAEMIWIRRTAAELPERYQELAADPQVAELMGKVGDRQRLGPARNYTAELRRLAEYDALAFASSVPIYLQSGRVRLAALVNDSACVTFSWSDASDAVTYLPASAAPTLAIEVPADAPRQALRIGGRTLEAREVTLASIRVGNCVSHRVQAYLLPPEGEDLGAQLAAPALSPRRPKVELARLRMELGNDRE
jgi:hypothetical protein